MSFFLSIFRSRSTFFDNNHLKTKNIQFKPLILPFRGYYDPLLKSHDNIQL